MANIITRMFKGTAAKSHRQWQVLFGGSIPSERSQKDRLKLYTGWVYSAIGAIAEDVAQIELQLLQLIKGELVEVFDNEVLALLNKVNPWQSRTEFLQLHQTYMELAGESFWLLERGTEVSTPQQPIKELWLLRPDLVEVVPDKDNFIKGYTYKVGRNTVALQPHEVIHFKYPHPTNPYRGYSPIEAGALSIDTWEFSSKWNKNFFYNSARPDAVLQSEHTLDDDEHQRLRAEWDAAYRGGDNSNRIAILEKGIKYEQIQVSAKDLDFMLQKNMTRDEILGIWRVPKTVVGITDDVNRANAEATNLVFSSRVIKPKMRLLVDTLNEFLLPQVAPDAALAFTDPTPQDRERTIKEYESGHNRWLTTNDIRQAEGLEPVDGGDVIYQQISLFPIGAEPAGEPVKQVREITVPRTLPLKTIERNRKVKTYLLNRSGRVKRREDIRKRVVQLYQSKEVTQPKVSKKDEHIVELTTELVKAETQRDFYESENKKLQNDNTRLADEKAQAEKLAADTLGLHDKTK